MTRQLGSTGLAASPLGLGLAALGRPAYITSDRDHDLGPDRSVSAMERRCHEMLDAAYGAGVRYIDAARSYGLAEEFLSTWVERRRPPDGTITIGSKWGYAYVGSWRLDAPVHEIKDLSFEALRAQLLESRKWLGNRLCMYQIHSATLESGVLDDQRVLTELGRLKSEGLAIGLTTTGPAQADTIRKALTIEIDGVNLFQSVQATWNLLETSAGPALAEAHDRGIGVIIKEVLGNGRLAAQHETAFAAALSQPWADVVLSGAVTPSQLQSNLHALDRIDRDKAWPSLGEAPTAYWDSRRARKWE